jgi:hypothetical protein
MIDPPVIECPNCGAINQPGARYCTTCEVDLQAWQPDEPPAPVADAANEAPAVAEDMELADDEGQSPAAEDEPAQEDEPADRDETPVEGAVEESDTDPEPEPEEEVDAGEADAKDAEADIGQTGPEAADTSGWGTLARKMLLDEVAEARLTIGVIGNFDVGKTFFINQLAEIARSKRYSYRKLMIDPRSLQSMAQTTFGAPPRDLRKSETLPATLNVWVHNFIASDKTHSFRVIDIPGEFFGAALGGDNSVDQIDDGRVAMLYPALGISDAIILVIPSHQVFPERHISAQRSAELLGDIRLVSNLIEAMKEKHGGDLAAAVEDVLSWELQTLKTQMVQLTEGLSKKPTIALFSQADRCFGVGVARSPAGLGMDVPENDPLLCAARQLPTLVNQLRYGFEDFRVDFLTAAEGQPDEDKEFRVGTPSIGVWPPIEWLRQRVALRQAAEPAHGRLSRLLHRILMTDRLGDDKRNSGWAIELRMNADKEFRSALTR